jgi:phenylpropionate dioxygenase-like ring-hydroxylating dioxygenase large terminal subunit
MTDENVKRRGSRSGPGAAVARDGEIGSDAVKTALASGMTLPSSWYTSRDYFELEQTLIFERTWQCVGHMRQLARGGDFLTSTIGRVPVVVTRDDAGGLHGLVNVCRHRAHEVAHGTGNRKTLQCPYHGWTYNLDGSLRVAPRADRELTFDKAELGLLAVRIDSWGPFVFANLDPKGRSLRDVLGGLPELMSSYEFDFARLEHRKRIVYELATNWKVYVENSIECYHCPVAHLGLTSVVEMDPDVYKLTADDLVMTHESRLRAKSEGGRGPLLERPSGIPEFQFYYVWPSFMIAPSPNRLWVGIFEPLDEGSTRVVTDFYFGEGFSDDAVEESIAFSDQVLREDQALVESVQRGLRSGRVEYGRLLPKSETLVGHFQWLVHGALTAGEAR